jgi:hypothetical protein
MCVCVCLGKILPLGDKEKRGVALGFFWKKTSAQILEGEVNFPFRSSSQRFLSSLQCVPQNVPNSTTLLSHIASAKIEIL